MDCVRAGHAHTHMFLPSRKETVGTQYSGALVMVFGDRANYGRATNGYGRSQPATTTKGKDQKGYDHE
eukprot:1916631-Amphidinium_carterae.1